MAAKKTATAIPWNDEHDEFLIDLAEGKDGKGKRDAKQISASFNKVLNVARSPSAIANRIGALRRKKNRTIDTEIGMSRHRSWNTDELRYFVEMVRDDKSTEGIRKRIFEKFGAQRSDPVLDKKRAELKVMGEKAFIAQGLNAPPAPAQRASAPPPSPAQPSPQVTPEHVAPPQAPEQLGLGLPPTEVKNVPREMTMKRVGNTLMLIEGNRTLLTITISHEWFKRDDEGIRERCWDLLHDVMRLKCAY